MTTQHLTAPATYDLPPLAPIAAATFAGTAFFSALGTVLSAQGDEHGWGELAFVLGIALVAVVGVMALVRRFQASPRAGTVAVVLAGFGLATVLVFFMGVTPAFAVGGIVLGGAARRAGRGSGSVAIAIGALALVGYVAIYLSDLLM